MTGNNKRTERKKGYSRTFDGKFGCPMEVKRNEILKTQHTNKQINSRWIKFFKCEKKISRLSDHMGDYFYDTRVGKDFLRM